MVKYTSSLDTIREEMLIGFFAGWPYPPDENTLMKILMGSYSVCLAVDDLDQKVVGFITAISDGVLSAYIPLLEVRPEYQHRGIGKELVHRMLQSLDGFYMIDLLCDADMQGYYEKLGMFRANGMLIRNHRCLMNK